MRIEIIGNSVAGLSSELNGLENAISNSISKLKSTKKSIEVLQNGASGNTNSAIIAINNSITQKQNSLTSVQGFQGQVRSFVDDTTNTDKRVANLIKTNDKALKNELTSSSNGGNGILDSIMGFLKDAWDGIKDAIASAWEGIQNFLADALEWLQDNWKTIVKAVELIIAVVGVIAAFCVSWIAGVALLAGMLIIAIIDMTVGGTIWEHIIKIGLGIALVIGAIFLSVEAMVTILVGVAIAVVVGSAMGAFNAWMDEEDILSGAISGGEDALVIAGISVFVSSLMTRLNAAKEKIAANKKPTGRSEVQKSIVDQVESGEIELNTNIQKGNYGEMKMDLAMEERGYKRISLDSVTDLNAPTHQGIDGVYYNPNGEPPYVVCEAKYNTATLNELSDGTMQMSDVWIEQRLDQAVGPDLADEILMEGYGRELYHVDVDGTGTFNNLN